MTADKNYGLLAAVDWNSNKWANLSTEEDLNNSDFGYAKETGINYSCLNFGHLWYPADGEGNYSGLLPQLVTKTLDRDKATHLKIVFLKSRDYTSGKLYIVGFYAFPLFHRGKKASPLEEFEGEFDYNVKAKPADIHILENYYDVTELAEQKKFMPRDKKVAKQGFNYLQKQSVFAILDGMTKLNPDDKKLSSIKLRLLRLIN